MHRAIVLGCGLLVACAPDGTPDLTFDPCSPLVIVPAPDTEADELASVRDAVAAWTGVLPTRIEVGEAPAGVPALSISFESGDTFYRALYMDQWGEIMVSRERLAPADRRLAIAHELGHAFGLVHVDPGERASVMNVGNLEVAPTADDGLAIAALWPACGTE